MSGNFIHHHHVEPRVKLFVPRKELFHIPLKYIAVPRTSNTSLDVLLEKNIDDYCNVVGDRELSGTWTGFTRFTVLNEKPTDGFSWFGARLTRKQTTSRPDTLWPEIWKDVSDASERKEKQKWAIEKPKLDNTRKMRGIHFIDLDDGEFKDIIKNAHRKVEVPMPVAMLCKTQRDKHRETCSVEKKCKTKYACIVEADESTRKRMEGSLHKYHADHIAGKGMNSLSQYNLVRQIYSSASSVTKIQMQRLRWKRKREIREDTGMAADESQKQKRGDRRSKE